MSEQPRAHMLASEPIPALLLKMAVPAMIAMGVNALYNLVDTIYIGRGVGPEGIGGISIAFPFQILILAIALMVGMGSASLISRLMGRGDYDTAAQVAGNAAVVTVTLAGLLAVCGAIFLEPLLRLMGAPDSLLPYAHDYLSTILPGAPFIGTAITFNHVIRAEGKARTSMTLMLVGAGMNIILDPVFIFGLQMGVRGAALATVISQFISFLFVVSFYASGRSALPVRLRHLRVRFDLIPEVLAVGLAAFVRQFGQSFFIIITNNVLRSFGDELAIAAFGVINKLLLFSTMPLVGIAHGFQPIAGFNFGAGNIERVRKAVRTANLAAVSISITYFVTIMFFPRTIFGIFTTDAALLNLGSRAMQIVMVAIPLVGMQLIGSTFFQAIGKAWPALILSMSRQMIVLIPLVVILPRFLGTTGVWLSFPLADLVAMSITVIWLRREMRFLHIIGS